MLTEDQVNQYHSQGYLVLERAIAEEDIAKLKAAALEIVKNFDIDSNRTVFKTTDRDSGRDDYFFNSAESTRCFLDELLALAAPLEKSGYGLYLKNLLNDSGVVFDEV